jgi:tetratricopeptide (TPR) repeat protein
MTSDKPELEKLLEAGLAAAQTGNYARARDLLLQVVEQDESNEAAWVGLGEVVENPGDKITALENALALNSGNVEVQARLAQLRGEAHPPGVAHPVEDNWRKYLPEVPLEGNDGIDDPYQCPYCGAFTGNDERHCPHCKQGLYMRVSQSQGSEFLRFVQLMLGISLALGLVGMAGPLLAITFHDSSRAQFVQDMFGITAFFGAFTQMPLGVAQALVTFHVLRAVLVFGLLLLLNQRWAIAFYATLGLMIADLLWNTYLLLSGNLGPLGALLLIALSAIILILLITSDREFPIHSVRVLTRPDTTARSAADFYKRGHDYRKLGMWALAVAQWRRAVGLAPEEGLYYKDLGIGYAKIKRFDRSLRVLKEAQQKRNADHSLAEIIALVEEQASKEARAHAG